MVYTDDPYFEDIAQSEVVEDKDESATWAERITLILLVIIAVGLGIAILA